MKKILFFIFVIFVNIFPQEEYGASEEAYSSEDVEQHREDLQAAKEKLQEEIKIKEEQRKDIQNILSYESDIKDTMGKEKGAAEKIGRWDWWKWTTYEEDDYIAFKYNSIKEKINSDKSPPPELFVKEVGNYFDLLQKRSEDFWNKFTKSDAYSIVKMFKPSEPNSLKKLDDYINSKREKGENNVVSDADQVEFSKIEQFISDGSDLLDALENAGVKEEDVKEIKDKFENFYDKNEQAFQDKSFKDIIKASHEDMEDFIKEMKNKKSELDEEIKKRQKDLQEKEDELNQLIEESKQEPQEQGGKQQETEEQSSILGTIVKGMGDTLTSAYEASANWAYDKLSQYSSDAVEYLLGDYTQYLQSVDANSLRDWSKFLNENGEYLKGLAEAVKGNQNQDLLLCTQDYVEYRLDSIREVIDGIDKMISKKLVKNIIEVGEKFNIKVSGKLDFTMDCVQMIKSYYPSKDQVEIGLTTSGDWYLKGWEKIGDALDHMGNFAIWAGDTVGLVEKLGSELKIFTVSPKEPVDSEVADIAVYDVEEGVEISDIQRMQDGKSSFEYTQTEEIKEINAEKKYKKELKKEEKNLTKKETFTQKEINIFNKEARKTHDELEKKASKSKKEVEKFMSKEFSKIGDYEDLLKKVTEIDERLKELPKGKERDKLVESRKEELEKIKKKRQKAVDILKSAADRHCGDIKELMDGVSNNIEETESKINELNNRNKKLEEYIAAKERLFSFLPDFGINSIKRELEINQKAWENLSSDEKSEFIKEQFKKFSKDSMIQKYFFDHLSPEVKEKWINSFKDFTDNYFKVDKYKREKESKEQTTFTKKEIKDIKANMIRCNKDIFEIYRESMTDSWLNKVSWLADDFFGVQGELLSKYSFEQSANKEKILTLKNIIREQEDLKGSLDSYQKIIDKSNEELENHTKKLDKLIDDFENSELPALEKAANFTRVVRQMRDVLQNVFGHIKEVLANTNDVVTGYMNFKEEKRYIDSVNESIKHAEELIQRAKQLAENSNLDLKSSNQLKRQLDNFKSELDVNKVLERASGNILARENRILNKSEGEKLYNEYLKIAGEDAPEPYEFLGFKDIGFGYKMNGGPYDEVRLPSEITEEDIKKSLDNIKKEDEKNKAKKIADWLLHGRNKEIYDSYFETVALGNQVTLFDQFKEYFEDNFDRKVKSKKYSSEDLYSIFKDVSLDGEKIFENIGYGEGQKDPQKISALQIEKAVQLITEGKDISDEDKFAARQASYILRNPVNKENYDAYFKSIKKGDHDYVNQLEIGEKNRESIKKLSKELDLLVKHLVEFDSNIDSCIKLWDENIKKGGKKIKTEAASDVSSSMSNL